jgi:hypothetical protein
VAAGDGAQGEQRAENMTANVVVPYPDYSVPIERPYVTAGITAADGYLLINATDYLLIKDETLKGSTSLGPSPTTISLASQPTTPDLLEFVIDDNVVGGTIGITGTDTDDAALVETISIGVHTDPFRYTSTRLFKTVGAGGIVITGPTAGTVVISARDKLLIRGGSQIQSPRVDVPYPDYSIPVPEPEWA